MTFTLEDLMPLEQQLTTVQQHETISHAIDLITQQGYGQLPVVLPTGNFCEQPCLCHYLISPPEGLAE